jgi:hypothetical protein
MKLLVRQYVASLRERGELDAILPDLLSEIGYDVISRPSIGTRQYGVDIAAVGRDEDGERKLFLFSVKQGDLSRTDWDGTPQALRPSLDEIREIYLRLRVARQHQKLKVVICLCFGGDVLEAVQDNVIGYIEANETERISFKIWNGDVIASLLIKGVLRESLLPSELRTSFQKAVAMVDEPEIAFLHFGQLVRKLCSRPHRSARARTTTIRQLYLMLWVLFVWARDAGNVESAYQSSELAVLQAWQLLKTDLGHDTAASREAGETFNELVELHFAIFDELVSVKILPHVDKRHAISMAVGSSSPVDINLKMFDLAGRIALHILWRLWRETENAPLPSEHGASDDHSISELTQSLVHLIRNNPSLLSPMQDAQSIEIALGLMAFTMQKDWQKAGANWIEALIDNIIFNYRSHGRYPTIEASYRELLRHPREKSDEYRKDKTAGSTIIPLLRLWEVKLPSDRPLRLANFAAEHIPHCNCQLWFADEDSEDRLYNGDDRHGAMLNGVPVGEDLTAAWEAVVGECDGNRHFQSLSAIDMQHWPIILMACRHYRIPVPPNLWIDLIRPENS